MSARDELIEIVTSNPESSGGDSVWATDLVDAYRAEVRAEHAALLRRAADHNRTANRHDLAAGLQRGALLLENAGKGDDAPSGSLAAADRQTALLDAIRQERSRRWKSGRAANLLRSLGFEPISTSTASHDLAALATAGHLARHEQLGVRYYTLRKDDA